MKNVFDLIKKSAAALQPDPVTRAVMSSGETARRTKAMMGNLTPEEQQMINTETAKGSIARRVMAENVGGMYQKPAFTDSLPGGLEGAQKRVKEGTATLDDILATGNRRSRYGGFGTTREQVPAEVSIQGRGGYGVKSEPKFTTRDITQQEYVDNFNKQHRPRNFMDELLARDVSPDQAAVTAADVMKAAGQPRENPEKFIPTSRGVFSTTERGIVDGTAPQAQAAQQIPDERFTTYAGSPVVKYKGFLYTWKPGVGYTNPKPIDQGADLEGLSPEVRAFIIGSGKGGAGDYSSVPDLGKPDAMTRDEFVADFTSETGGAPTAAQIEAAKGKYWN